ncbi:uncharacterized protein LOC125676189 isoform X1 [Ostrea edulis]|uniref:uncharacterized protein LOC125676189 isoform X1 n=1 Tax=Ostrea edulis TaxID=37623 RepID=UPI0024AF572D|nr:uncharacterized protein LOC125676189 isoform X1 [Ostrea edulis]
MEERTPGDEEKGPVRKRPRIDVDKDSSTDLEDNELRYSDQTGSIIQERNSPDPFPDLTKDQRVVLYTLLLCVDYRFDVVLDDDVTMGGIDVRRTLSELKEKGLVTRYSDSERFHISQNTKIMKSYGENCLLSDIDKDFYMQVASDYSLCMYTLEYLSEDTDIEQPVDTPITVMRLIVEGRIEALIDIGFDVGPFHWNFADKEFQTFIQEWCRMKNIDPIAWADGISFEEAVRFVSAYSILGRFEKGFTELVSDKKKWSILVFILMSENCSIRVNALWEEKHRQILGAFPSLRELNHDMRTTEAIDLIKDMVYNDKVLAMNGDGSNGTVGFVSDDVRHQVMGCFVLNCLKTDEDYKNYLNLSSVNSLLEYVRTWWHDPDYGERCMYIPERMNELLITQLGIDVIRHVMVEGREDRDCNFERFIGVREMVSERLNIPHSVFEERQDTKVRLCSFLKTAIQEQEVSNRWIYNSLIGSFMIGENSPISKDVLPCITSMKKWSILVVILMSVDYKLDVHKHWKEDLINIRKAFPVLQSEDVEEDDVLIEDLMKDKVLGVDEINNVIFVSDDVRHLVMSFFVKFCLQTDDDYKNYLNLSSVDSLMEYSRNWLYIPKEGERHMYIPEEMEELFIRRLGIDAILHVMVEKGKHRFKFLKTRDTVSAVLKVPREILDWDYAARSRYAECARKGTQTIHRARAMIVGCAGAGKSTLLKRLQKRSLDELKQIQSTVGLEVHEDIFEITPESDCLKDLPVDTDKEGKQLLSVVDFGGQCAYYACHQVYLSRRAFYLLVIDMSKAFDEKVDPKLCEQAGTMFTDWSYGEYLLFWLKSVHTYCDNDAPVIIVGTHLDETKAQNSDTLYNNILDNLKFDKHLKSHLNRKRCFVLGFKSDGSSFHDTLSELEKCMVSIAKEDRWKESIPTDWALSEVVLGELRRRKVRIKSVKELSEKCFGENKEKYTQIRDILKFYHDIGVILHFDESSLAETVIIDIQWFVDSFKNIITDPNHIRDFVDNDRDWYSFYISGHILDRLLTDIWNSRHFEMDHWERNQNKANLLQYMQRLGLIAVGTYAHYIPCMNKRSFGMQEENFFHTIQSKTSVLVFRFQFLPYFFYFRLIVACLTKTNGEWIVLEDNGLCLYKNVACFVYKQHAIALAVNRCSIQLQVFQPSKDVIVKDVTLEIRDNIERLLNGLTSNFHKKVMYTVGYQCSKQEVFREHDDCFVEERDIHGKGKITCPKHGMINHHILSESTLLVYWKQDVLAEITDLDDLMDRDECTSLSEPELRKFNFKTFDELTKIGRDALQLYFDRIFPPMDLATVLTNNKQRLQQGHQRLDTDQCTLLFPGIKTIILFHLVLLRFHKGHIGLLLSVSISGVACSKKADKSIPSSTAFDVTVMYKLLRNYGPNLPPPTKGWGKKPDIGEKRPTDDVERIRFYRNEVEHKTRTTSVMEKDDFKLKWEDLSQAILRLSSGSLKKDIMALRQQR